MQFTEMVTTVAGIISAIGAVLAALRSAGIAKDARFWRTLDEAVGYAERLRVVFAAANGGVPPPADRSHEDVREYFRANAPDLDIPDSQDIKRAVQKLPKTIAATALPRLTNGQFAKRT